MTIQLYHGDCLEVMRTFGASSIDAIVTDPPAGISFMGKGWDHDHGGRDAWIANMQTIAAECLRVLKPGGHALVWALPRTSHWTATAWENAGFEVRDRVAHVFGSGFPKSQDVSKAIDRAAGAEREVVGVSSTACPDFPNPCQGHPSANGSLGGGVMRHSLPTAPATPDAERWAGWGTALKPAMEDWWLLRKPFRSTVAANVLEWGTGAMFIDGARVETDDVGTPIKTPERERDDGWGMGFGSVRDGPATAAGRWPPNFLHDGSDEVKALFPQTNGKGGLPVRGKIFNGDGAAAMFNYDDTGSAARFYPALPFEAEDVEAARIFYCAKASNRDRNEGLEDLPARSNAERAGRNMGRNGRAAVGGSGKPLNGTGLVDPKPNHHPTVKPTSLMRWLVRLVTPRGGTVLDPFMGSGSTGKAAVIEDFNFIGIEQDAEYLEIARRRIDAAQLPLLVTG